MDHKVKTKLISTYSKDSLLKDNPYQNKIDKVIEKPMTIDTLKKGISELID